MSLTRSALETYCRRIGFTAEPRADVATLQQLHALHPQAIPFENLNSWLGLPVPLDPRQVYEKLVLQKRGGYCFEQNLLFSEVLQAIGFTVQGLSARVLWNLPSAVLLPRTHMVLLVAVGDSAWLADVGFGGLTMSGALRFDDHAEQPTAHERYRILQDRDHRTVEAHVAGSWQALYRFSLEVQVPADYEVANWYISTHPQSRFRSQLIASRADAAGRHAVLDTRYNRHYLDKPSEQQVIESPQALRTLLEDVFLIDPGTLPGFASRLASLFKET